MNPTVRPWGPPCPFVSPCRLWGPRACSWHPVQPSWPLWDCTTQPLCSQLPDGAENPRRGNFLPDMQTPGSPQPLGGQERGVPSHPAADKSSLISVCPRAPLHPCLNLLCHGDRPQERNRTGPWQHRATMKCEIWGLAGLAAAPGLGFWGAPGKTQLGGGSFHLRVPKTTPGLWSGIGSVPWELWGGL